MRTNEADTNTGYERAFNFKGLQANTGCPAARSGGRAASLRMDFGDPAVLAVTAARRFGRKAGANSVTGSAAAFTRASAFGFVKVRVELV